MKPYTLAEAVIAAHTKDPVEAGNICGVGVDFAFANDITAPPAIRELRRMGARKVFDVNCCAILPDHFTPNRDIASAEQAVMDKLQAPLTSQRTLQMKSLTRDNVPPRLRDRKSVV